MNFDAYTMTCNVSNLMIFNKINMKILLTPFWWINFHTICTLTIKMLFVVRWNTLFDFYSSHTILNFSINRKIIYRHSSNHRFGHQRLFGNLIVVKKKSQIPSICIEFKQKKIQFIYTYVWHILQVRQVHRQQPYPMVQKGGRQQMYYHKQKALS